MFLAIRCERVRERMEENRSEWLNVMEEKFLCVQNDECKENTSSGSSLLGRWI